MRVIDLVGAKDDEGWFLATYVKTAGKVGKAKSDKGIANDRSSFNRYVRGRKALLKKRVTEVTPADLNRIKAAAPASTWRKIRNALVVCFRHGEEQGELPPGTKGLVCATRTGEPTHPNNITHAWAKVREKAKLDGSDGKPPVRLHDLRHSWASDAVSAGMPLYVVGKALGHKVPSTTARYAHVHDAAIRSGLAAAGKAIDDARRGEDG